MKKFELMQLPYSLEALEPHIGKLTMEYHYGKHYRTYLDNLNKLIAGTAFEQMSLEEIVKKSTGATFNTAAQVFNHAFTGNSLAPDSDKEPSGGLLLALEKKFGTFEELKRQFTLSAMSVFGSGWVWLVKTQSGKLEIVQTANADTPICQDQTPLLVCDVWEHAYYIDKQNRRADYLDAWWKVVDWKAVSLRY